MVSLIGRILYQKFLEQFLKQGPDHSVHRSIKQQRLNLPVVTRTAWCEAFPLFV